jgi:hypothetical protein
VVGSRSTLTDDVLVEHRHVLHGAHVVVHIVGDDQEDVGLGRSQGREATEGHCAHGKPFGRHDVQREASEARDWQRLRRDSASLQVSEEETRSNEAVRAKGEGECKRSPELAKPFDSGGTGDVFDLSTGVGQGSEHDAERVLGTFFF